MIMDDNKKIVIKFSLDDIKNMDLLYTYTPADSDDFCINGMQQSYHGKEYCQNIIENIADSSDWAEKNYDGMIGEIGNETFTLVSLDNYKYEISFGIKTYYEKIARIECVINAPERNNYDRLLENLKISLKDKMLEDWNKCTWLSDDQSALLCKEAYGKAFMVENNLRAFASKVLIHFLGINWIRKPGMEKIDDSIKNLEGEFTQRVPEFDDINVDFLSMTLETLSKIMFEGIIYKEEMILSREQYDKIQSIAEKGNVADYLNKHRPIEINIWEDLFSQFYENPDDFRNKMTNFISARNHVAHSKVLTWNSYNVILQDFENINEMINKANVVFKEKETSMEEENTLLAIEEYEYEDAKERREYYRYRLSLETGIKVLDEADIVYMFDEKIQGIYNKIYQHYHLDVRYEISDYYGIDGGFTISSPVVEDNSTTMYISGSYEIDDDLGEDSYLNIICQKKNGEIISKAEIRWHNGNGNEGDNGFMLPNEDSELDESELDDFMEALLYYIENELNPYPGKLEAIIYANKGYNDVVADFPCEECGEYGVSVNKDFLKEGRCCYCGYENELGKCNRCQDIIGVYMLKNGLCPSCSAYVERQMQEE